MGGKRLFASAELDRPVEDGAAVRVAHLTTVDSSLRYLLLPQLLAVKERGLTSIGISGPGPDVGFLVGLGIEHISLHSSTRSRSIGADLRAAAQLWSVLRRERIDVLHTHNPKPGVYGRIVGRLAGVPIVINTVHGLYASPEDRWWKRAMVYALEWIASRFSDAELVQSMEDVETMTRFRVGRRGHVHHLGNGINLKRFTPASADSIRRRVRDELDLDDEAVLVGCVARLVSEKGIPELIEAYSRRRTQYELVIIGPADPSKSDALRDEDFARAEELGVKFLGQRDDVDDLYHAMDIFVLPSHREGFPRAAMEAAATGLPIVATDIRGCREVVADGTTGILVPRCDVGRLARAIELLVEDDAERMRMSLRARARAESAFDELAVVERVLSTYRDQATRKGLTHIARAFEPSRARPSQVGE